MSGCPRYDGGGNLMYVWDYVQCVRDRSGNVDIARWNGVCMVDSNPFSDGGNSDDSAEYSIGDRGVSNMWWETKRRENSAFEVENDVPTCYNRAGQEGIIGGSTRQDNRFNEMLEAM